MLDVRIIEKHILSMKENYPDTKEPKKPERPKEPTEPKPGSKEIEFKRYEDSMERFPKRIEAWARRLKKWEDETHPRWQLQEDRLKNLRQLKMTEAGTLIGGSSFRAIKITGLENELEKDCFIIGDGNKFPRFERIFDSLKVDEPLFTFNEIAPFKKFVDVVAKAVEQAIVEVENSKITFRAVYQKEKVPEFVRCSWELDRPVKEPVTFGIDTSYLLDMLKLFQQLKIKNFDMYVISPIRPLVFISENVTYIITPIRIGK